MARFVKLTGYDGFLVVLDEMVNLFKLVNAQARNQNYEQILRIVNDVLQGNVEHLGVLFGGTPEFLMDSRRGLYSYGLALTPCRRQLCSGWVCGCFRPCYPTAKPFGKELYVLLTKLRHMFACGDETKHLVPDEALHSFMEHCSNRIGDAYFRTPRNTIKAFLDLLSVLEQNPGARWDELLNKLNSFRIARKQKRISRMANRPMSWPPSSYSADARTHPFQR